MFTIVVWCYGSSSSQLVNCYDIVLGLPWPFKACFRLSTCIGDTYWLPVSGPASPKHVLPGW